MALTVPTPHDRFFKHALSDSRVARAFFEFHLPDTIRQVVDLNSLQMCSDSFIDEHLQLALTDMLFSAHFAGRPGYVYLIAEHQSSPDRWMPFRLLKYMVRIMERHLQETQGQTLPIIYPLVFYHGEAGYNYSTDILDLFDEPTLAERILFKPFQLVDVNTIPDEALKQQVWVGVMELCFKHIFARDLLPYLQELIGPLQQLEQAGGQEVIKAAMTYLMAAGEVSDQQAFIETLQTGLGPEVGESIMTIAQQLETKGIEKGKAEGRAEGEARGIEKGKAEGKAEEQQAIAKRCLAQGLSLDMISQITGLSVEAIKALTITMPH